MNQPCPQHAHPRRLVQQPLSDLTARLRAQSRKITGPRQAILDVLRSHAIPLTNRQIHHALGKSDCDLATIYRTMHTLLEMGLVRRCDFGDGTARFELSDADDPRHHHHLVCRVCNIVVEIDACLPPQLEADLALRHGFSQIAHHLQFFGVCPRCKEHPDAADPAGLPGRPGPRREP